MFLLVDFKLEVCVFKIVEELCCLVCQNEIVVVLQVDLVKDLCQQICEQFMQGCIQFQILEFMLQCYGDFVFYCLLFKFSIVLLWVGLFVLLLVVIGVLLMNICWCDLLIEVVLLSMVELWCVQCLFDEVGGVL